MMRSRVAGWRWRLSSLLLATLPALAAFIPVPGNAQAPGPATCASCHDQAQKMQKTVHAALDCATTCHTDHDKYPHPAGITKPVCVNCHSEIGREHARGVHGRAAVESKLAPDCAICHGSVHEVLPPRSTAFRKNLPDTCGMCHETVVAQYKASVHGRAVERGVSSAPLCTDCHGEHSIQPHIVESSPVHMRHIRETCARCHGDIRLLSRFGLPSDRITSFDASFHGLAARAGSQTVANCASCHGVHNILPSLDPKSTVNARNLASTCGQCHPGAGRRFALGAVHQLPNRAEAAPTRWARIFYLVLIPLLVGLMALHNAGDWIRKLLRGRTAPRLEAVPELRMFPLERVQHELLAASFLVLAWSGFALKYPDPWWARPLTLWGRSWELRGLVHRMASVVFLATAALHALALLASPRLRSHWRALRPGSEDFRQAWRTLGYNLGWRSSRAWTAGYSYTEKVEYWTVVWGGIVMVLTGIVLWAHDPALRWLPKWAIDLATTVHFYEAVLATLAIVVWHSYSVIFDPDVYPLDTAFLTGFSSRNSAPVADGEPSDAHE